MTRILALLCLLASPASANRMSMTGLDGQCFAVIVIYNIAGGYNDDETLMTDFGAVVVQYDTIGGHNATDADQVAVVTLPDGVMADPMFMELPDGDTGRICLMNWVGL